MSRTDIINFVKKYGNVGSTQIEYYIDYPNMIDGDWAQVVYWEDERDLAVYLVDDIGNGEFINFDDYSHKEEIEQWINSLK